MAELCYGIRSMSRDAFRRYGHDVETNDADRLVSELGRREIREPLAAALTTWALAERTASDSGDGNARKLSVCGSVAPSNVPNSTS